MIPNAPQLHLPIGVSFSELSTADFIMKAESVEAIDRQLKETKSSNLQEKIADTV
jgi:hypothetical protein